MSATKSNGAFLQTLLEKFIFILFAICSTSPGALGATQTALQSEMSSDSDQESQKRWTLKVEKRETNESARKRRYGLGLADWTFQAPSRSELFRVIQGSGFQELSDSWSLEGTYTQLLGDWSPSLFQGSSLNRLHERWTAEFSISRDLVDSITAIRDHTLVSTLGASADFIATPDLTLVAATHLQWVSDSNRRQIGVGRVIYSPKDWEGFRIQVRAKRARSDFRGIGYFSPDEIEEVHLLAGISRALWGERWRLIADVGPGRQTLDRSTVKDATGGELAIRGWFNDNWGLEAKGGCSKNIGQQVSDNYDRCFGMLQGIHSN